MDEPRRPQISAFSFSVLSVVSKLSLLNFHYAFACGLIMIPPLNTSTAANLRLEIELSRHSTAA